MSKWGLSDGIIAQLRDNLSRYEQHLHKKYIKKKKKRTKKLKRIYCYVKSMKF
ncbi:hypothetical protein VP01_2678g2 [Puccinia sorghi]|uniref:Uncharacterized protein n=1 Tax=Puccinia sorghi TaxID=27349 RepID=A0A0L6V3T9_9BASI|nr:hypothetical protein VP01_2678g2 [Puccinia sorghi]